VEPELSLILPAYKEAGNIERSVTKVFRELSASGVSFEIIVVVDGLVDNTSEILRSLQFPNLKIIEIQINQGKGAALRIGILSASSRQFIGYMDADLDLEPWSLTAGLNLLFAEPSVDLVVGSKLHPKSIIEYPLFRKLQSHAYRVLVNSLFNLGITDTQTGLKIGRALAFVKSLPDSEIDGFAFDLSLLVNASKLNFRLSEVPVELNYQFESSVRLKSAIQTLLDTFRVYRRATRE
jgi:dolichyl-phosphate beta-glucosyltransferase